jgi:glucosamine 6-phosphate synthetase-like amidotransferase/phosphosugar isomerase protein
MNFSSRFERNIWAQPDLVKDVFSQPIPTWMRTPLHKKITLVGVGTNYHAAQITSWLWNLAGLTTSAVHSFDFVMGRSPLHRGDWGIFLSHRGSKSYTVQAEKMARKDGARTAILTGRKSPWYGTSCRIETGPMEDTGAFTQSLTTTLAWLMRWPSRPSLLSPFRGLEKNLSWGPRFPRLNPKTDIIFVGDSVREWVAHEIALKVQETSYLPARAFGLEEFLHGPQLSTSQ